MSGNRTSFQPGQSGNRTSFRAGQSGNPAGRPKSIGLVSEIARRYTVDAVDALVRAARLRDPKHAAASVAAAKELLAIGYPGIGKSEVDPLNAGGLHLIAVQTINQINYGENNPHLTHEARFEAREMAETDAEERISGVELLPDEFTDLPDTGLELWEAEKARKRAASAAEAATRAEEQPHEDQPP